MDRSELYMYGSGDMKTMVQITPKEGVLPPSCLQTLSVVFKPGISFCEINSQFYLKVEGPGINKFLLNVHGKGASSKLSAAVKRLDFGSIRVGLEKSMVLPLENEGNLCVQYFAECNDPQVTITPEQGLLDGGGTVDLVVRFRPNAEGLTNAVVKVVQTSAEPYPLKPLMINLKGFSSYPDVILISKEIDFGMALLGFDNVQAVKVENRGLVEARLSFQSLHSDIRLEEDGLIVVPPEDNIEFNIVYKPQKVEKLVSRAILKCADPRGDMEIVQFRGEVGVPNLVVHPLGALDCFDFGVCKIKEIATRTLSIVNEGNIDLKYQFIIQRDPSVEKDTFTIAPMRGQLKVQESASIKIDFRPRSMMEASVKVILDYKFSTVTGIVKGTGGRAIITVDMTSSTIDFGLCRIGRTYTKEVVLFNNGNYSCEYWLRPEPPDGDWDRYKAKDDTEYVSWADDLRSMSLEIVSSDGFCKPYNRTTMSIRFKPTSDLQVSSKFRVYYDEDGFTEFEAVGKGAVPQLLLMDGDKPIKTIDGVVPKKDVGTHPVASETMTIFNLLNPGPFGVEFLLQPMGIVEFDVAPRRGFVESGKSIPLRVYFRPKTEEYYQVFLKILWELEPINLMLTGSGGVGRLVIEYSDEKDMQAKALEYGMVPNNSVAEKRIHIYNNGQVDLTLNMSIDVPQFTMGKIGDPFTVKKAPEPTSIRPATRRSTWQWFREIRLVLQPKTGIEIGIKFDAKQADISAATNGNLVFSSNSSMVQLPLRGKSGTFGLSHRGDLGFGDIASNFLYKRKVTLVNSGSIPAVLSFEWQVAGNIAGEGQGTAMVKLLENFGTYDPRSGWARQQYAKEKKLPLDAKLTARDYWKLIHRMSVRKKEYSDSATGSRIVGSRDLSSNAKLGSVSRISSARTGASSVGINAARKRDASNQPVQFSKRRQAFFSLITTTVVSSQSSSTVRPYLRISPSSIYLPPFGSAEVLVDLVLATEDTFMATLTCRSNVPSTSPHEIALTATPKIVTIILDDTAPLDFGKQPIGESEVLTRTFKNVGKKDITWKITHKNPDLQTIPSKGSLGPGASVRIDFIFCPKDENLQTNPVFFEPDCSTPVRLPFCGGGGIAKISLTKFKRFDFGFCMMGKNTESGLPITNEGNAILHLTVFDLADSRVFKKGQKWPMRRISLHPGDTFVLPIVFCPNEENPPAGRLVVGTNSHRWEIELVGSGREAVLIVSRISMEFIECVVGNFYEQKLGLKNVGDVNYPVEFRMEPPMSDFVFDPPSVVLKPFSEGHVLVKYNPRSEVNGSYDLVVSSPYSTHTIPMTVHSGTIILEFSRDTLDFGLFEKSSRPSLPLVIRNTGTLKTNFTVRTHVRPPMFQLSMTKGQIQAKKTQEIFVTHTKAEVHEIDDYLTIKTDAVDTIYHVQLRGNSEEACVKHEEFAHVNLGICPALQATCQSFSIRNYGRFPLHLQAHATYPLKIHPTTLHIEGGEEASINVTWHPSGGYELRSLIHLETNIGPYDVTVRGKALLPEVQVRNQNLDFGICALEHTYESSFTIINKGKVPLYWNIGNLPKETFVVAKDRGELAAGTSEDVGVSFTATSAGRKVTTLLLELRGLNFKELRFSGIGGSLGLKIYPENGVELGPCPCLFNVSNEFTLLNTGEVTLHLKFEYESSKALKLNLPGMLDLKPRRRKHVKFSAIALEEGPFSTTIFIKAKEGVFPVSVKGQGIKIHLREKVEDLLKHERLDVVSCYRMHLINLSHHVVTSEGSIAATNPVGSAAHSTLSIEESHRQGTRYCSFCQCFAVVT